MADLIPVDVSKVKGNILKMINQGAPEADIDAYLQTEGVTPEFLRGEAPTPTVDPSAQGARDVAAKRMTRGVMRASAMPDQEIARLGSALDAGVRMAANGMTFGLADRAAGAADVMTGQAPSYDEGVKAQRAKTQAIRDANPIAAGAAEAAGGLVGGVGLIKSGLTLAGRTGPALLPRVLGYGAEGAAYGGAHGVGSVYSENPADYLEGGKKGATLGAMIGGGLPVAGSAVGGAYRLGSAFFGPQVDGLSRGASALLRSAAQADEVGLRALPQMGREAMLVDAGPAMMGLGQGSATGTGAGRSRLVEALRRRDAATGDRLARTLDTELGAAPIPSRVESGLKDSRKALSHEYETAFENAKAVDTGKLIESIDGMIPNVRGAARSALKSVRDDLHITDAAGNTGVPDPHPRALLAVRQSIDGMLEGATDGNVRRVLGDVRKMVDAELKANVPGVKAVDAKFAELKEQSKGLERGQSVFDAGKGATRPAELADEIRSAASPQGQMVGPSAVPLRIRQGARAEVDRLVGTHVNDLTTLERTLATPNDWNYQKFGTVFGDGPRDRIAQALMNNRRFRESYQNIVQNSQTAQRTGAAQAMDGAAGGNVPADVTVTGLGLKALNLVAKTLSGASNANTKDEIGRVLASQGPDVQRIARALLDSAQKASTNSRTLSRLISAPQLVPAGATAADRR